MNALSTLGMTPVRRRIYEAGVAAERERVEAEAARREAAAQARRDAIRDALEAALASQEAEKQAAIRAAAARHPVSRIVDEVAAKHGITAKDILSECRLGHFVLARQEAMWRARQETPLSLPAIGRRFGGRDHTTVLHGIRQHQKRLDAPAARATGGEGCP